MYRKEITLTKKEKIFLDHPVQSEQNKLISGHIHSTKKDNKTNI